MVLKDRSSGCSFILSLLSVLAMIMNIVGVGLSLMFSFYKNI